MQRIVSLISSGTEILCDLGLKERLVGISHECDHPPDIRSLPQLFEPKINATLEGGAIDQQVQKLVSDGLSIYRIHTEKLAALKPDLIVTQDQCAVCAVSLKDVEEALCNLTLKNTKVVSLKPETLDDIWRDFIKVGTATGTEEKAEGLRRDFWIRLNLVNAKAGKNHKPPKVLCLEWLDPLIVAGGWMPEIVELAGAEPLIVSEPIHFKKVTWEDVYASRPDKVVIMPCGYPIEKTLEDLKNPALSKSLAALGGECFIVDGNAYFNRPGPRIVDSCEILAAIAHPDLFPEHVRKFAPAIHRWNP